MSDDPREHPDRGNGASPPASFGMRKGAAGSGPELDRLPPPAFPPGSRRRAPGRGGPEAADTPVAAEADAGPAPVATDDGDGAIPNDAFISPDEPIVRASSRIEEDAFISPDEPFPPATAIRWTPATWWSRGWVTTLIWETRRWRTRSGTIRMWPS